jgi:hypothetical protein
MQLAHAIEVSRQRLADRRWQLGDPIAVALAAPDEHLARPEVDVLDAHLPLDREPGQKAGDLDRAELSRVSLAVKQDVSPDPCDARLLGAPAQVPGTELLAHGLEEPGTSLVVRRALTSPGR